MADDSSAAQAIALLRGARDVRAEALGTLTERQKELAKQKRSVTQELKNEKKRQKRVLSKAGALSDEQLMSIIIARSSKAKAKAKAKS